MAARQGLFSGHHTAGLYADMTVDGPEIGTLVLIIDRAKNLPSRRTMGKQDPYCAARLGKEAKKTSTDVRGGQTPRWDQEIRFVVHDSPDYHNLKVSIFNDDKRTDLIGETWIALWDRVVMAGGGRHDGWHSLNYKGKYAGEVRIEMSYYDSRAPERPVSTDQAKKKSPVKRRPLPTGPSPAVIPQFGPRAPGCARGTTVYLDENGNPTDPPSDETAALDESVDTQEAQTGYSLQQDVLPENHLRTTYRGLPEHTSSAPVSLVHSQSVPNVHSAYMAPHHQTLHPSHSSGSQDAPVWDERELSQAPPSCWDSPDPSMPQQDSQPWISDSPDGLYLPPLPPSHGSTPRSDRNSIHEQATYVSPISPLQRLDKHYDSSPLSKSVVDLATPPRHSAGPSPLRRELPSPRQTHSPSPTALEFSPSSRSVIPNHSSPPYPLHEQPPLTRHSLSDPYGTVGRPHAFGHPLGQGLRRSTSPQPYVGQSGVAEPSSYHFPEDSIPVIRPRALPSPRARHSIASIQHPVSTFAVVKPPSAGPHGNPRHSQTPLRKSISSQRDGSPASGARPTSCIPFGPDAFDHLNPSSLASQLDAQPSPHNPYHIPDAPSTAPSSKDTTIRDASGKIVGFDGREIDPSDHLPVDSWAPEPEAKIPVKTYGSSPRGFGPRTTANVIANVRGNVRVNVRTRRMGAGEDHHSPTIPSPVTPASPTSPNKETRNRLQKRNNPFARSSQVLPHGPLREMESPNSYPSRSLVEAAPPKPPKIPMNATVEDEAPDRHGYGASALSSEMAKIDIGGIGGRRGMGRPPPGAVGAVRGSY